MATVDDIIYQLEPELRQALLDAFDGIRKGVDMNALRDAVERGDVAGVEEALNVDDSSFAPYAIVAAMLYMRSGIAFAPTIRAAFNPLQNNTVAQENVARMVEEVKKVARDMVLDRRNNAKRIRASIGLNVSQQSWVAGMRAKLSSGDAAQLRAILKGNNLRDKRYDPLIKKAIETGRPIPQAKIDQMADAYTRKLIRKRAEDIAATEAVQYTEAAKYEAARNAGGVVQKTWRHSRIWLRARKDHVEMNGVAVNGIDTPFIMDDGTRMLYAHDPAGGARHNASCRCRTRYRRIV